jgi:hypothetical protein
MSKAAVFLEIEKAFYTKLHLDFLYELSKLKILISLIKRINSFLSQRKLGVSIEGEMSAPRNIQAEVPQGSILSSTLYNIYINVTPQTPGIYLGLFADDTCIYVADRKQEYILRKLQRNLSVIEMWCER